MIENARFFSAGKFVSRGEWMHPEISIDATEVIIVISGTVKIEESGVRYTLSPGDVLFLTPGVVHRGWEPTNDKVSFWWVHITDFNIDDCDGLKKHFTLRDPYNVSIVCRQLLHYSGLASGKAVNDRLLYVLLYELTQQNLSDDSDEGVLVRRIREWLRLNSSRTLTAGDVAAEFAYNEDYISRLCKRYYGSGLSSMINELKIAYIKQLLLESDLSLAEISQTAGFDDYTQFRQFFKYHAGMPPSEFRQTYYAIFINNK